MTYREFLEELDRLRTLGLNLSIIQHEYHVSITIPNNKFLWDIPHEDLDRIIPIVGEKTLHWVSMLYWLSVHSKLEFNPFEAILDKMYENLYYKVRSRGEA